MVIYQVDSTIKRLNSRDLQEFEFFHFSIFPPCYTFLAGGDSHASSLLPLSDLRATRSLAHSCYRGYTL